MSFIFAILFFILFLVLFLIMSVFGFIRSFFSLGKHNRTGQGTPSQDVEKPNDKMKIFDKNEGEYVDFEEIKEDK